MALLVELTKKVKCYFTRCHNCRRLGAEKYRQRTQYYDDELNWATLCNECRKGNDEYWDERWAEYYGDISFF